MSWKKYLPGNGYWTGRSDLLLDPDRVKVVNEQLEKIKGAGLQEAEQIVYEAVDALNETLVNTGRNLNSSAFEGTFKYIYDMIGEIETQIDAKVQSIKDFEKQTEEHPFKAGLATAGMCVSKFGEGFVSVFEDVGDAAVTITAGWGSAAIDAIAGTNYNESVSDFIEKDITADTFSAINEATGIEKYSLITSDSGLSNLAKGAGMATGYLTLSGYVSGVSNGLSTAGKGGKVAKALSSTTNANTLMAGVGGYGGGVETSLKSGQTFLTANLIGLAQGGLQAGVAYGMGKWGEHKARKQAVNNAEQQAQQKINAAEKSYESAEKSVSKAMSQADDEIAKASSQIDKADDILRKNDEMIKARKEYHEALNNGSSTQAQKDALKKAYDDATKALKDANGGNKYVNSDIQKGIKTNAQNTINTANASKDAAQKSLSSFKNTLEKTTNSAIDDVRLANEATYQGYSDPITNASRRAGDKAGNLFGAKTDFRIAKKGGDPIDIAVAKQNLSEAKDAIKPDFGTVKNNLGNIKNAPQNIKAKAYNEMVTLNGQTGSPTEIVYNAMGQVGKTAWNGVKGAASTVVHSPATPGVIGATVNGEISSFSGAYGDANKQFNARRDSISTELKEQVPQFDEEKGLYVPGDDSDTSDTSKETVKDSDTGKDDDRRHDDGGGDGGYDKSTTQFRTDGEDDKKSDDIKAELEEGTEKTPDEKPTELPKEDEKPIEPPKSEEKPNVPEQTTPPSEPGPSNPKPTDPVNPSNPQPQPPTGGGGGGTSHTGGGYNKNDGYVEAPKDPSTEEPIMDEIIDEVPGSIDDVIKGSEYTKIPTSKKPIEDSSSGGSAVIPIVAGLSAAAAAGIGAKAYMDHKNNNDTGDDSIETEEWSGEDNLEIDYSDGVEESESYLDDDDDYGYQTEEPTEKYGARNNEELADLQ